MNWFKEQASTDTYIKSSVYPGLESEADGIDLREEMNIILYGNSFKKPLGHWVILRHFDRTTTSKYWNSIAKEGVNGPAYKYNDTILRTRRVPVPLSINEDITKAGSVFDDRFVYYFEYDVSIILGDQIYELDTIDHKYQPTSYSFTEKYDIKRVHPYRLENGNVQYFAAIGEFSNITY